MIYSVTKRLRFDAAHRLPFYKGKCFMLHGHSYVLDVTLSSPNLITSTDPVIGGAEPNEFQGMVIDFADIKDSWKKYLEPLLDHKYLNESLPELEECTTAERIAEWLFNQFSVRLNHLPHNPPKGYHIVQVTKVQLWETEDSYATVEVPAQWMQ